MKNKNQLTKFSEEIFNTDIHSYIIEELGEVYAWELSYKLAGQRVYVPKRLDVSKHHQLGLLSTGLQSFLVYNYAGESITIPMGSGSDYKQRQIQSMGLIKKGCNHNQVASQLKVSHSTARRYKKKANDNDYVQEELF